MSKRKNLEKRAKAKMARAANEIVKKLTPEQQDKLAEILAKAVAENVANNDTLRS
jgi:Spy/CpxP family protein refolding chaperone